MGHIGLPAFVGLVAQQVSRSIAAVSAVAGGRSLDETRSAKWSRWPPPQSRPPPVEVSRAGWAATAGLKPVCLRENRYVTSSGDAEAVLVTGVYGAGKSTVVADIGKLLSDRGERYGLLDVDWLGWFDAGRDAASHRRVVISNITTVCEAYLAEGVRRLALAWSIRDRSQLDELRQAVSVPMRVVRLDVDAELMRRRLLADPTEERQEDDLTVGLEWLAAGYGAGLEDLLVPGDRPVRETSEAICRWLGWI